MDHHQHSSENLFYLSDQQGVGGKSRDTFESIPGRSGGTPVESVGGFESVVSGSAGGFESYGTSSPGRSPSVASFESLGSAGMDKKMFELNGVRGAKRKNRNEEAYWSCDDEDAH